MKRSAFLGLVGASVLGAACHQVDGLFSRAGAPAPGTTPLTDVTVDDLRARFERDAGKPRLVLLVSPT